MMMGLGCQARRCPRLGAARLQPVAAVSPASSCPRVATPGQTHSSFSSGISSRKARNVVRRRTEQLERRIWMLVLLLLCLLLANSPAMDVMKLRPGIVSVRVSVVEAVGDFHTALWDSLRRGPRDLAPGPQPHHRWALLRGLREQDEQRQRMVAQAGDMDIDSMGGPTSIPMPNIFWRAFAAFMYIIPWIDMLGLGRWVFHQFPWSIILYYLPGPFVAVYYFNQWMPLIVFFLVFLSVVKNTKLHHFVRFNSMQAIMIDICTMLVLIVKMYLPAEIRWTWISVAFASIGWWLSMTLILYCVFFTLKGQYADIPFVSDAVYTQIDQADIM